MRVGLGRLLPTILVAAAFIGAGGTGVTLAASPEASSIQIELNALQPADTGCRAVFVLRNHLPTPIANLTLRVVAFDTKGQAKLFMSLQVGAMAKGKTRVLRFDLGPESPCRALGRFVLDDITACEIDGAEPTMCLSSASLSTRADIPFDF